MGFPKSFFERLAFFNLAFAHWTPSSDLPWMELNHRPQDYESCELPTAQHGVIASAFVWPLAGHSFVAFDLVGIKLASGVRMLTLSSPGYRPTPSPRHQTLIALATATTAHKGVLMSTAVIGDPLFGFRLHGFD